MSARQNQINFRKKLKKAGYKITSFRKLTANKYDAKDPKVIWFTRKGKMYTPIQIIEEVRGEVVKTTVLIGEILHKASKALRDFKLPAHPLKEMENSIRDMIGHPRVKVTGDKDYITHVDITCPNREPWRSVFKAMDEEEKAKEVSA